LTFEDCERISPGACRWLAADDALIEEFAGRFDQTIYPPGYLDEVRSGGGGDTK
jgi:hypothetical protein